MSRGLRRIGPFIVIHAALLIALSQAAADLAPAAQVDLDRPLRLAVSYLRELVVLGLVYWLVAGVLPKRSFVVSTVVLTVLIPLTTLYFLVTVKTTVVYGIAYLLDELVPFLWYYVPSYLTSPFAVKMIVGGGAVVCLPHVLRRFFNGKHGRRVVAGFVSPALGLGVVGWRIPPPAGVPEHIRQGPLYLLVLETLRESTYEAGTNARLADVDALRGASIVRGPADPPKVLRRLAPFERVILYQMEGVSDVLFRPDSPYVELLPRLAKWSQRSVRFENHHTLSTLTFHSYQSLNIGGYLGSGSRLEMAALGTRSLVRPIVAAGFETAFFSAADLDYRGTARFLERLGFTEVIDFGDYSQRYARNGRLMDDRAIVDRFKAWSRTRRRFFAVLKPMETHHPYWDPKRTQVPDSVGSGEFRTYLSSLHYQNEILGDWLDYVDRQLPDTLVVVLSDHGVREYFAEIESRLSPYRSFAASFEVRFHVPLYSYLGAKVDQLVRSQLPSSHVDIILTIIQLMGLDNGGGPRGTRRLLGGSSLLSSDRKVRFLNTQHNLDVLALLDGRNKYLLERETGRVEAFSLNSESGRWSRLALEEHLGRIDTTEDCSRPGTST